MFQIGSVSLALGEEPNTGQIPFPGTGPQRWVRAGAYGLVGTIKQLTGQDGAVMDIHCVLDDATVPLLKAISDAGQPVVVTSDRMPFGVVMTMTTFLPVWNDSVRGGVEAGWDTHIVMEE